MEYTVYRNKDVDTHEGYIDDCTLYYRDGKMFAQFIKNDRSHPDHTICIYDDEGNLVVSFVGIVDWNNLTIICDMSSMLKKINVQLKTQFFRHSYLGRIPDTQYNIDDVIIIEIP
jgi:hypothetical protein